MIRADVIAALSRAGMFVGQWQLDDAIYEPISAAFVGQAWDAWVQSLPLPLVRSLEVGGGKTILAPNYQPEAFDCDSIASNFAAFLDLCMARDAVVSHKLRGNTASGRFDYFKNGSDAYGHSRIWFIDYEGTAQAFDPGNRSFAPLTAIELSTIFFGESI